MSACTDACVATMKTAIDAAFDDYNNSGSPNYKDAGVLKGAINAALEACDSCIEKC